MDLSSMAAWAVGLALFLGLFCCPLITWVEERRHFKQISFVRTMVVVQAWIVLTTLEAVRLAVCKYVFRQDVRTRAHQSCGIIARFILRTFFDGYAVEGRSEHCPAHVTNEASFSSASSLISTHSDSGNDSSTATPSPGSSGSVSSSTRSTTRSSTRSSTRSRTASSRSSSRSSESKAMKKDEIQPLVDVDTSPPPPRPVVLIANHQSMLDVAAIFALELKVAWVAKTAVFMMPGVGWLMYMAGYVPVERKSSTSIKHMYAACKACVQDGWSLVIFPQGTRSRHGPPLPFKKGAFNLAAELELPLLPVSIHIPSDIWLNGSKLTVQMHAPVLGCCDATLDNVLNGTFHTITSTLVHEPLSPAAAAAVVAAAHNGAAAASGGGPSVAAAKVSTTATTTAAAAAVALAGSEEVVEDGVPRQRRRSLRRSSSSSGAAASSTTSATSTALVASPSQSGNGNSSAESADSSSSGSSGSSSSGSSSSVGPTSKGEASTSTSGAASATSPQPSSSGKRRGRGTALILKASAQGGLA